MAKNVCPGCREVVLSFGLESSMKCSKCDTVIKLDDPDDDNSCVNTGEQE